LLIGTKVGVGVTVGVGKVEVGRLHFCPLISLEALQALVPEAKSGHFGAPLQSLGSPAFLKIPPSQSIQKGLVSGVGVIADAKTVNFLVSVTLL
jgi:hypothetical protein